MGNRELVEAFAAECRDELGGLAARLALKYNLPVDVSEALVTAVAETCEARGFGQSAVLGAWAMLAGSEDAARV